MALTIRTDKKTDDLLNELKSKLGIKTQSGVIKKVILGYQDLIKDNHNLTQDNRLKDSKITDLTEVINLYLGTDSREEFIKNRMIALTE